jgi:hypothetical protein
MKAIWAVLTLMLFVGSLFGQQPSTPQLTSRPTGDSQPENIPGVECVRFNPNTITLDYIKQGPRLSGGGHWLFGKSQPRDEKKALRIIQHYGMNTSCWFGQPVPQFHFMLVDGTAPAAKMDGEDCISHQVRKFRADTHNGRWFIVQDLPTPGKFESVVGGYETRETADTVLQIISRYGLTDLCFGSTRPGPGFDYWKAF